MAGIFISYRRELSAAHAGRLRDRLKSEFGDHRVFMDIHSIDPGVNFTGTIGEKVGSCDALVVVIGKRWCEVTDSDGKRKLDNPDDWVRLEIAAALKRNIPVIPMPVDGAQMPSKEELPGTPLPGRRHRGPIIPGQTPLSTQRPPAGTAPERLHSGRPVAPGCQRSGANRSARPPLPHRTGNRRHPSRH